MRLQTFFFCEKPEGLVEAQVIPEEDTRALSGT